MKVTKEHPIYDPENQTYRKVKEFHSGDTFAKPSLGLISAINIVSVERIDGPITVYNLHVDDDSHNYVAAGVLVHNKTPTPTPVSTTYSISGDVFIDTNSNKVRDGAETNYTDGTSTITYSGPVSGTKASTNGSYNIGNLPAGTYTVRYTSLPGSYQMVWPLNNPPSYSVTVGPNCNANGAPSAGCLGGHVGSLRFAIIKGPPTPTPTNTPTPPPAAKPDLIVTGMSITYDGDNNGFICSKGLGLSVSVKNQGTAAVTGSFAVKANNTTGTITSGLAVGVTKTIWIKDYIYISGPNVVTVDVNNQIAESNEANNTVSQMVPVPTQPLQCVPTSTPKPPTSTPKPPTSTPKPPTSTPKPPTSTPGGVTLALDIALHGIGAGGDNANPTGNSLSNKNPLHPVQSAFVQIFDSNNQLVTSATGEVQYDSNSGKYTGAVNADLPSTNGSYIVKLRTNQHLVRLVPGIQTFTPGQTSQLPQVDLIAGDITNDNRVDILDYNSLLDCYSDLGPAPACNDTKKVTSDLNDDDSVNQFDYNLFLRELSTQPGA